jgi:hypothetical protein
VIPVKPLLPDELAKWELITHGRHAFNVIAGSFEIEHFHGQTNIRVLDPLRVTLESEVRGVKPAAASSEMGAPIYQ